MTKFVFWSLFFIQVFFIYDYTRTNGFSDQCKAAGGEPYYMVSIHNLCLHPSSTIEEQLK